MKYPGKLDPGFREKYRNILFPEQNTINSICSQVAGKREPEQEAEAQRWVETVIGNSFPPGKSTEYFSPTVYYEPLGFRTYRLA